MNYVRMNLRIGKATKQALVDMAEDYGMSQNSLAAYILGQFVSNHRRVVQDLPELLIQELQKVNVADPGADA
jgi:hypothetical protein